MSIQQTKLANHAPSDTLRVERWAELPDTKALARNCIAEARSSSQTTQDQNHETADGYIGVIAVLSDQWRVIVCKDAIQWILQRRKRGGAERPWRGSGYCRTRQALIRLCATSCGRDRPRCAGHTGSTA